VNWSRVSENEYELLTLIYVEIYIIYIKLPKGAKCVLVNVRAWNLCVYMAYIID